MPPSKISAPLKRPGSIGDARRLASKGQKRIQRKKRKGNRKKLHHALNDAAEEENEELLERLKQLNLEKEMKQSQVLSRTITASAELYPEEIPVAGFQLTAWGWNANRRAGNVTEEELRFPRQVQRSASNQFINCAAGKHHSLAVSNKGIVYSFGDGRKGQLGYGNMFTLAPYNPSKMTLRKGALGALQGTPLAVTPTGLLKANVDLQIGQVAGGGSFSFAREISPHEGASVVSGFLEMEEAVKNLLEKYSESTSLRATWSHVRQERCEIDRGAEGALLAWGTGVHGELGLGPKVQFCPYPSPVLALKGVVITQISAGERHMLAIDDNGRLFSWGYGKSGRLGHGDAEDRQTPCLVEFFASTLWVDQCSAGFAHSAVLTRPRSAVTSKESVLDLCLPKLSQFDDSSVETRRLSTFGRGAHGRLGYGSNRTCSKPVLVSQWPSFLTSKGNNRWQLLAVTCGGAHTLALAAYPVKKCLANPWGVETVVLAWGFGTNGQLGDGYAKDRLTPVRCRMHNRCEVIVEISAGKTWSAARSADGQVYTWGKGLRGQLGQGAARFSLVPRPAPALSSFLKISSGYSHNVGITTAKKLLNGKLRLTDIRKEPTSSYGNIFRPLSGQVLSLVNKKSTSAFRFDCCRRITLDPLSARRVPSPGLKRRAAVRFDCESCNLTCICYNCAKICHRFHKLLYAVPPKINASATKSADGQEDREAHLKRRLYCFDSYNDGIAGLRSFKCRRGQNESFPIPSRFKDVELLAVRQHNAAVLRAQQLHKDRTASGRKKKRAAKYSGKSRSSSHSKKPSSRPSSGSESSDGLTDSEHDGTSASASEKDKSQKKRHRNSSHRGGPFVQPNEIGKKKKPVRQTDTIETHCCRCGLFHSQCRMIPTIPEVTFIEKIIKPKMDMPTPQLTKEQSTKRGLSRKVSRPDRSRRVGIKNAKALKKDLELNTELVVLPDPALRAFQAAARTIQRGLRAALRRWKERVQKVLRTIWIREAAVLHYKKNILQPIFDRIEDSYTIFRQQQELKDMKYEEKLMKKYTYFSKLQVTLRNMNGLLYGVRKILQKASAKIRITVSEPVQSPGKSKFTKKTKEVPKTASKSEFRPTLAFSLASIRLQQLCLHPSRRASVETLALLTRRFPRVQQFKQLFPFGEGVCSDVDMALFTDRFIRDRESETARYIAGRTEARMVAARRKRAEMVLRRLQARQNRTRDILAQAEAASKPPAPPAGPPPRHVLRAAQQEEKEERKRKEEEMIAFQKLMNDAPFGGEPGRPAERPTELAVYNPKHWPRRRRASIGDAAQLHQRLTSLPQKLRQQALSRRRLSVPSLRSELAQLMPKKREMIFRETGTSTGPGYTDLPERPAGSSYAAMESDRRKQVGMSLGLFQLRQYMLDELFTELNRFVENSKMYSPKDRQTLLNVYNKKIRSVLSQCCSTPRLPLEMLRIVKPPRHYATDFQFLFKAADPDEERAARENEKAAIVAIGNSKAAAMKEKEREKRRKMAAFRERRNSIGEPERLHSQLAMMFSTRMKYARLVRTTREGYFMRRRRRSFDVGEARDAGKGVLRKVGYEMERVKEMMTVGELMQDAVEVERAMLRCKMIASESDAYAGISPPEPEADPAWVRKDDQLIQGFVSSFRPKRKSVEDLMNEEDRLLLEAAAARQLALENAAEIWQEHFLDDGTPYFYNVEGDYSLWELPSNETKKIQLQVQCETEDGELYWLNETTGEITPIELIEE